MTQRVDLRESPFLFRALKCLYAVSGFLQFALFLRLLVLLPLVGRRFLPGGIHDFFYTLTLLRLPIELVLSLSRLLPVTPASYIFSQVIPLAVILVFNRDPEIQRHTVYSLYIADVSFKGLLGYVYHYKKLTNLGRVPLWLGQSFQLVSVVEFPLRAVMEFAVLFMGLKHTDGYYKLAIQFILLVFIPAKLQLYKLLILKYFRIESGKVE